MITFHRTWPILVFKERKNRYVIAAKLSRKTTVAIIDTFCRLNPEIYKSIAFDKAREFAKHKLIKAACKMSL
ncbi:MAG: hypothetical protein JKY17_07145 [Magnetovibrio sp.]|nr:hypothetical protein [Magnetovibrio sp.]